MTYLSLKKYTDLNDVIKHIKKNHRRINSVNGVHAWKILRLPNGDKIPFEELQGVRLRDFSVYDHNTLIIEQNVINKTKDVFFARTYLFDLVMINIYDSSVEFYTNSGIDMFYTENTVDTKIIMLSSWICDIPDIMRAQWFKDDELEALLDFSDKKEQRVVALPRNIDFEKDL